MPSTTNRAYSVPNTGDEVDLWGANSLNPNFEKIDQNLGAVSTVALTNANVTLSANQYVCGTIRFTGTLTGNVIITFPSVSGWWVVDNQTTGAFYVQLSCGAGNKIATQQGTVTDVMADGSAMAFRNLGKIGEYWDYGGSSVPVWVTACTVPPYLHCDGSTFSAATYPHLNTILGGNTLPDTRGRGRFNLNGGTSRITTAGSGIDGDTRFSAGGAQTVTLDSTMIPLITPTGTIAVSTTINSLTLWSRGDISNAGSKRGITSSADGTSGNSTPLISASVTSTGTFTGNQFGGGLAHNNMPPAYIGGITMIRAA